MNNTFVQDMGVHAGNTFKQGYNCSEAIVQAFRQYANVNISDEAFSMASGFGGGMGHARDVCGSLAGCVMVISTLAGRRDVSEKPLSEIYPLIKEFHTRFKEKFGSTSCKDLMQHEFGTKDHLRNCLKLTNEAGMLLAEFLLEKNLIKTTTNN